MTEKEIWSRTLPDHLASNLDVVIVRIAILISKDFFRLPEKPQLIVCTSPHFIRLELIRAFSLHTKDIITQGRATISVIIIIKNEFSLQHFIDVVKRLCAANREVSVSSRPCSGTDDGR
jgi:hypothetical protein